MVGLDERFRGRVGVECGSDREAMGFGPYVGYLLVTVGRG